MSFNMQFFKIHVFFCSQYEESTFFSLNKKFDISEACFESYHGVQWNPTYYLSIPSTKWQHCCSFHFNCLKLAVILKHKNLFQKDPKSFWRLNVNLYQADLIACLQLFCLDGYSTICDSQKVQDQQTLCGWYITGPSQTQLVPILTMYLLILCLKGVSCKVAIYTNTKWEG